MCVLYALSGPVLWIYRRQGRRNIPESELVEKVETEKDDISAGLEADVDVLNKQIAKQREEQEQEPADEMLSDEVLPDEVLPDEVLPDKVLPRK